MIIVLGFSLSLLTFLILFWFASGTSASKAQELALKKAAMNQKSFTISSKDIENVTGNDVLETQLDLARAYIETGRTALARNMLRNVAANGAPAQKQAAEELLATVSV
jgi:FimV-like protein